MNNLNSIIVEGNLVRDPQLKTTPNGHQVCSFSVASNRFYRQNDETEKEVSFFEVETWSRLAQTCAETLKKGRGVRVVGRLKQDRWEDASGKTQAKIKIVILSFYTTYNILLYREHMLCLERTLGLVQRCNETMTLLQTRLLVLNP